jgi:hypothetical protein
MNWLQTVLAFLQLAPGILQTIATVQTIVTAPKQGAVKKAVIMHALVSAPPEVQTMASSFIDSSVASLKAAGALTPSVKAA